MPNLFVHHVRAGEGGVGPRGRGHARSGALLRRCLAHCDTGRTNRTHPGHPPLRLRCAAAWREGRITGRPGCGPRAHKSMCEQVLRTLRMVWPLGACPQPRTAGVATRGPSVPGPRVPPAGSPAYFLPCGAAGAHKLRRVRSRPARPHAPRGDGGWAASAARARMATRTCTVVLRWEDLPPPSRAPRHPERLVMSAARSVPVGSRRRAHRRFVVRSSGSLPMRDTW